MAIRSGVDRREQLLFPPCFDDYVTADNPVRVIDAFVENVGVKGLGLDVAQEGARGAPAYDPLALAKLYVYGYSNRITSSRELEKATHRNIETIWLVRGLRPDHWTVNEFRKVNSKALKRLFRQFHLLCMDLGLVGRELVAIDSSFFKGSANSSTIRTQSSLSKEIAKVDGAVEQYLQQLKSGDGESPVAKPDAEAVKQAISELGARREQLCAKLEAAEASPTGQYSEVDPDCRLLKKSGKTVAGYQVQAAVEAQSHMIVEQCVMDSGGDCEQLAPMAKLAREALGGGEVKALADGGYYSEDALEECEKLEGVEVHVPLPRERTAKAGLYPIENFKHDPVADVVVCPQGKRLERKSDTRPQNDHRLYHAFYNLAACRDCPVRAECTRGKYRKVHLSSRRHLAQAMKERLAAAPELYAQRMPTVEHPFGTIKFWMRCGELMTRGLTKVSGEVSLSCLCYNIKRAVTLLGAAELVARIQERATAA